MFNKLEIIEKCPQLDKGMEKKSTANIVNGKRTNASPIDQEQAKDVCSYHLYSVFYGKF